LIEQVHRVLGRYRDDDERSGWISGRDEQAGSCHPTTGGLRIGKSLKERGVNEAFDETLEWDRDGQYFHYLNKWIHALCQAAFVTDDFAYALWAVELGEAAFEGFVRRSGSGRVVGVYWKMSTDLSRPLVPALGLHDALDGLITFREAQHGVAKSSTNIAGADRGKSAADYAAGGDGAAMISEWLERELGELFDFSSGKPIIFRGSARALSTSCETRSTVVPSETIDELAWHQHSVSSHR
jgi:hypothetical protein